MDRLLELYRRAQSVFTVEEISLIWQETPNRLRAALSYYVKQGKLIRLRQGIYATGSEFEPLELAGRIFSPSYVSLETVLTRAGVIFQYRGEITVVSYLTREVECCGYKFSFRKIKDEILYDPCGLEVRSEPPVVSMASPARALVDLIYLDGPRDLGNPDSIDWQQALAIASRFGNKRLFKDVKRYAERHSPAPSGSQPAS